MPRGRRKVLGVKLSGLKEMVKQLGAHYLELLRIEQTKGVRVLEVRYSPADSTRTLQSTITIRWDVKNCHYLKTHLTRMQGTCVRLGFLGSWVQYQTRAPLVSRTDLWEQ
jgi:hypothetical protein